MNTGRPSRSPLRNSPSNGGSGSVPPRGTTPSRPTSGQPPTGRATAGRPGAKVAKRRKPIASIFMITIGLVLVLSSVGIYAAVNTTITKITKAIPTANLLGNDVATATSISGVINILMIGVDTRPGNTIGSRSDSIIIAHIPASHDRVYLVSIPRDSKADIPGHGTNKINSAFYFGSSNGGGYAGGAQLLTKTLKADYGLTFNAAAIVNFGGFEDIVTALHGVTMYVDEKTTSLHHGYKIVNGKRVITPAFVTHNKGLTWHRVPGVTPVVYTKGTHHLSAYEALDYVRIRDFLPNGDYDRERHQQQFVKAVMQEAVSQGMSSPSKASNFLGSISKAFIFDNGNQPMSNWIFTLKGINPSSMMTIKTNNGTYNSKTINGSSYEVLSPTSLLLLKDVKNDNLTAFLAAHPTWLTSDS